MSDAAEFWAQRDRERREPAPDLSWVRVECARCGQSYPVDEGFHGHRCPRRVRLLHYGPLVACGLLLFALLVASVAVLS